MNSGIKCGKALISVLGNRRLFINANESLYEGVTVPTALCGSEDWGMRTADRREVNVLEIKRFRNLLLLLLW